MIEEKQLLRIVQSTEKELYVQDIRALGHLLNGIELVHKTNFIYSNTTGYGNDKLSTNERRLLYKKEYRVKIQSINKSSPIEIELFIRGLSISVKLIDLIFTEDQQEATLKAFFTELTGIDFDAEGKTKLWKQIWNSVNGAKRVIKTLGLIVEVH